MNRSSFTTKEHQRANKVLQEIENRMRQKVKITPKGGEVNATKHQGNENVN